MDPVRLLEKARGGWERELLRSALTDVAPDAVRARVLASVSEALAGTASLSAGASTASATAADATVASSTAASSTAATASDAGAIATSSAMVPGWGVKLTLALKSVNLVYVCGLAALSLGAGSAWLLGSTTAARSDSIPALQSSALLPQNETLPPQSEALPPGAVADVEVSPVAASSSEPNLPKAVATRRRAGRADVHAEPGARQRRVQVHSAAAANAEESVSPSAGERPSQAAKSGLGAQLQLVALARQHLHAGELDAAERLIDQYQWRFDGGALSPEVVALRALLRERRAALGR